MNYGQELQERTMHNIVKVEEVLYESGHPSHPMIGFNIFYDDNVVYPLPPILLRQELNALLKDAFERGYREGAKDADYDHNQMTSAEVTE